MPTRTSIELHPNGCRLVEVELPARRRGPVQADVRVRTFASDVPGVEDSVGALSRLRKERKLAKQAWVTIWGLRSVQQFLRLPPAKPADLEALAARDARKDIALLEGGGDRATTTVVIGSEIQVGAQRRREVSLVAASSAEVKSRIQPIVDAGFVVQGVLTPALALTAVARAQRDVLPGTAAVYVALTARATCVAIVRDGVLMFAREIPWGHESDEGADLPAKAGSHTAQAGSHTERSHTEEISARLASELKRSVLYFKQTFRAAVEAVALCGDMPDLRALTAPLGAALDLPVKTLDSLVGIDAAAVPEPADQFRASVADLRLAIAAGADPAPSANLLPATIRMSREARTRTVRVAGAVAASLVLSVAGYTSVQRSASGYERERQQIEQELARLEPEAQRLDALRQAHGVDLARRAAVGAFDSQGPRLARFLEALSAGMPDSIVLTSVTAESAGIRWRATVTGVAVADDATSGQAAVNGLITMLTESPHVGAPVRPPSIRVVSGRTGDAPAAGGGTPALIPPDTSGVEFALQFEVPK